MLRYGYQATHKTALALAPYAGRPAEFIRKEYTKGKGQPCYQEKLL